MSHHTLKTIKNRYTFSGVGAKHKATQSLQKGSNTLEEIVINPLKSLVSTTTINISATNTSATTAELASSKASPSIVRLPVGGGDAMQRRCQQMVQNLAGLGITDMRVLQAMSRVPRHNFVEEALRYRAYDNDALPIGHQQTISQPLSVAKMIQCLVEGKTAAETASFKVLEIGTGCGYQAAVLSHIFVQVYSIERIHALHELAKRQLRPFRIPNIRLRYGDGMLGLPEAAPFDAIILAAAGLKVPEALLKQLADGGRLIAPVVGQDGAQSLQLIEKSGQQWVSSHVQAARFVPLLSGTQS
jgi:protein-L-isoaspartate(D-aspartate) O-methyltransferase